MFERFCPGQNCSLKFGIAFANDDLREMGERRKVTRRTD